MEIGYGYNPYPLLPKPVGGGGNKPSDAMWIDPLSSMNGRYFKFRDIPDRDERGMVADGDRPLLTTGGWLNSQPVEWQGYGSLTPTRHGGWHNSSTVNVLFFAGHVRSLSPKDALFAFYDPRHELP
jgi:hypothetical protein